MENIFALNQIKPTEALRYETGIRGLDFILNNGFVKGSTVLASGTTGAGKSTLFLQIADYMANVLHQKVLYIAGEENKEQIKMRANRMLVNSDVIFLSESTEVESITNAILEYKPSLVVIDSLQMVYSLSIKQSPMTPTQMRNGLLKLTKVAKDTNTTIIFIGHATKGGFIAGLQTLQHMVDTILYVNLDTDTGERSVEVKKNRFGMANLVWKFLITENGVHDDPTNYTPERIVAMNSINSTYFENILQKHTVRGFVARLSLDWLKKHPDELSKSPENHPIWKSLVEYSVSWLQKETLKENKNGGDNL